MCPQPARGRAGPREKERCSPPWSWGSGGGECSEGGPPGSGGLSWVGTASSSPHLVRRTAPGAGGSRRGGPLLLGLTQWPWKVQEGGRAGGRLPLGSAPRPPLHTASALTRSSLLSTPVPPDRTGPHITPQLLQHLSTHSLHQACQAPVYMSPPPGSSPGPQPNPGNTTTLWRSTLEPPSPWAESTGAGLSPGPLCRPDVSG